MRRSVNISLQIAQFMMKALTVSGIIAFTVVAIAEKAASVTTDADVALVLAADVSGSMTPDEVKLQREAYASALLHPDVLQAIKEGPHGRIYLAYFEWSDCTFRRMIVRWTVVDDLDDLTQVAGAIVSAPKGPGLNTCMTGAMEQAESLFFTLPSKAERYVLDISGDGIHNSGHPPWEARKRLLTRGVTINGLPITLEPEGGLTEWYGQYVIGGPGAFMEPVGSIHELEPALRRKLVQEIG